MASHLSFFSEVDNTWDQYVFLRRNYSDAIPIPEQSYFKPIHSIDVFSSLLVRPISSPLWLGVNAVLFFVKTLLSLAATLLLLIPAVALAIIAPRTELGASTSSAFKQAAAHTVVAAAMTVIAACAALVSLVLNPLFLVTRCLSTAVEKLNDITESTCGLTIARF